MRKHKLLSFFIVFVGLVVVLASQSSMAGQKEYKISPAEFEKNKAYYDDPRPYLNEELSYRKIIPPEVYNKMTYDVAAMKSLWAEIVGFKAPEVVGKIAPEVEAGVYSCKDKNKHVGLKKLMIPKHYECFNPGGPPHAGNFPEIKVVPTRQYYWALPIAEATRKYKGQAKLDDQGYLVTDSYIAGYPFPIPSGKFKAQQIVYNYEKRYYNGENFYVIQHTKGFMKNLKEDHNSIVEWWDLRLQGRVTLEPYGWYDERAHREGEKSATVLSYLAPRDSFGTVFHFNIFWILPDLTARLYT